MHSCQLCSATLPLPPRPILQVHQNSKILIIGQAPGLKTHEHNMPFNDKSGERLRSWLDVTKQAFYDPKLFAIMPMAFCYPGKNKSGSGDAPPPKICHNTWHKTLLNRMQDIQLTILIGSYAAKTYIEQYQSLNEAIINSMGQTESNQLVLPHPSPRNNIWLKKNDWFETNTLPVIKQRIHDILND